MDRPEPCKIKNSLFVVPVLLTALLGGVIAVSAYPKPGNIRP